MHDSGNMCDSFGVMWKPILPKQAQKIQRLMMKGFSTRTKSCTITGYLSAGSTGPDVVIRDEFEVDRRVSFVIMLFVGEDNVLPDTQTPMFVISTNVKLHAKRDFRFVIMEDFVVIIYTASTGIGLTWQVYEISKMSSLDVLTKRHLYL